MDNRNFYINSNFDKNNKYTNENSPSLSFKEYYPNYNYNNRIKQISPSKINMFDIYQNNNSENQNVLLNNKSENLNFKEKIINDDLHNYDNIIYNQNNRKYFKKNNFLLDEDKKRILEEERQKKLRYQMILDEQIQQKKIREEKEKEKKLKEDLLYEEKYRLEQQQLNEYQNINHIRNNLQKLSANNPFNNENSSNLNQNQNYFPNINYEDIMENIDQNELEKEYGPKLKFEELANEENQIYKYNAYPKLINEPLPPPNIENLVSTSTQIPCLNINKINTQGYKTQNSYYPNYKINIYQQQSPNYFISQKINPYMTQNKPFDMPQKMNSLSEIQTNISASPNPLNYQKSINLNRMMISNPNIINSSQSNQFVNNPNFNNNSQNINELINMNINNQNYIGKMMEFFFNEQNKIIEGYKETIKQLKNERDEALIQNKANEEKLLALQNMQKCKNKMKEKFNFIPFNQNNQDLDNLLSTIQKDELNNNSKKEEISIISDSKLPPLLTSSKLVKPNSNENILETWKKEEKEKENGKKLEFNGMDTNYIMNKISLIKNTILDNSNINNNNKSNDCIIDISLIGKTNEDKSNNNNNNKIQNDSVFNIETNEEINNINNKEEIINDNDSIEIISNKNDKCILINDEEGNKNEIDKINKNNIENKEDKEDKEDEDNTISQKSIVYKSKNKKINMPLYNIDNNISISTQLKQREKGSNINKKSNIQTSNSINNKSYNNKKNKIYLNNNNNKNLEINNKDLNEKGLKKINNNDLSLEKNYIIENNDINDINDINENNNYKNNYKNNISIDGMNDFPNIDTPKEAFHTVQTFNPNKNKNIESSKNSKNIIKNDDNKINQEQEQEQEDEMINKISFFNDNLLLPMKKKEETIKINKIPESNNNVKISNEIEDDQINYLNNLNRDYLNKKSNNLKESVNMNDSIKESSILNESLNTFTQNLNIKWKNMTKNDIIENNNNLKKEDLSDIEEDQKDEFEIFNKVNQYTSLANNKLEQHQLEIFNKENTIDKFDEIRKKNKNKH